MSPNLKIKKCPRCGSRDLETITDPYSGQNVIVCLNCDLEIGMPKGRKPRDERDQRRGRRNAADSVDG